MAKRYYWLKLKEDFFTQKEIKRLRRIAGGDTYTVIYLKVLLLSLESEGKIYFDGVGDDFIDELSLEIDEDIENIRVTLSYLQSKGLLEIVNENEYFLNEIPSMIGSESDSARRMRKVRERNKDGTKKITGKTSQSDEETSQCDGQSSQSDYNVKKSDTDIDIEKEKEKEKEKDTHKKSKKLIYDDTHMKLSQLLLKEIRKNNPQFKTPNLERWANDFRLMMERDKREGKIIQELILFSQKHEFWYRNILSAGTLRKQYDRLILEYHDSKKKGENDGTHIRDNEKQVEYDFKTRRKLW